MANAPTAYLVVHRDDGFGEVFPLRTTQRCTIGRATSSRIVLKDEMCSREHAEVFFADGRWYLRDLGSLNGSRANGHTVRDEVSLSPRDEIELGSTRLMFVESMHELPALPKGPPAQPQTNLEIRALKRNPLSPVQGSERSGLGRFDRWQTIVGL